MSSVWQLFDFSENLLLKKIFAYLIALGLSFQVLGLLLVSDGSTYSTNVSIFLMIPSLLAMLLFRELTNFFFRPHASKILLAFLVYILIYAALVSEDLSDFKKWLKICVYIILYLYSYYFLMKENTRLFDRVAMLIIIVSSIFAWATIINVFFVEGASFVYRSVRLERLGLWGLADLKNALVSALYYGAVSLLALFYFFKEKTHLSRSVLLVSLVGLCLYVLFTYSRSVWMALFFSYLIFMGINFRDFKKYIIIFSVVFAVFLVVVGLGLYPGMKISLTYRDLIWEEWFARLHDFWLLGSGPGTEFNVCIDIQGRNCFNQAHNLYMQLIYELGFVGLLLFVSAIYFLVIEGVKNFSNKYISLGLSWLVFSLTAGLSSYHTILTRPSVYWIVMWVPVAIILYCINSEAEKE